MKEKLLNEFKKVWGNDEKMIDFCMKKITGVVELENGGYFCFDKPSIETHFCFGYGQNGISTEEDFEFALQEKINASKKENFISENMKKFQFMEKTLDYDGKVYAMELYNRSNSNLRGLKTDEEERIYGKMFGTVVSEITPVDRMNLKAELSNQKKKFMKRLETYWKRYGSSKLKTWTYLVD